MNRLFVLAVGHRARQGKDVVAGFIKELRANVHIVHFADALYEEVRNSTRKNPLVVKEHDIYHLLHDSVGRWYVSYPASRVPRLDAIFKERGISEYWGMEIKDAPMLQFWGTDFRRGDDNNYWVKRTDETITRIIAESTTDDDLWIVISDTRFKNEVKYATEYMRRFPFSAGYYIRVVRLNDDGTQFIDPSRDPNHPSEIDIVDEVPFTTLHARSGELESLRTSTMLLLHSIDGESK